jgi:hypothetical protein
VSQCHFCRKTSYSSQETAAKKVQKRGLATGLVLHIYKCTFGNGWHITKKPRKPTLESHKRR